MSHSDLGKMYDELEAWLSTKITLSHGMKVTLRYQFSMSVFESMRSTLEVKDTDIKLKTKDAPVISGGVFGYTFSYVERRVLLIWFQYEMGLITQTQYVTELKRVNFTVAQATELQKTKGSQMSANYKVISE